MIEQAPHRMGRETPHRRFLRIGIDTLVAALVLLNWVATQLVAAALSYPPFFMGRIMGHLLSAFCLVVVAILLATQLGADRAQHHSPGPRLERVRPHSFLSGGCDRDRFRDHQRPTAQVARAGGPSR